jgi:hypothetical protein
MEDMLVAKPMFAAAERAATVAVGVVAKAKVLDQMPAAAAAAAVAVT